MKNYEEVSCGLCGENNSTLFVERRDLSLFLPGVFKLHQCRNCGLVYLNPRVAQESIVQIYPDTYDQYTSPLSLENSPFSRWLRIFGLNKKTRGILQIKKTGRLLDVGCATGDFLEAVSLHEGWHVEGIEINKQAVEIARCSGIEVHLGTIESFEGLENSYDVITMWNVIEHLSDPLSSLQKIRKLLKPDGIFVFNTPNLDSLDAKIFGKYWIGFELPRHFYVFSRKTVTDLLKRAGFRIVKTRCESGSHSLFMSSFRFFIRDKLSDISLVNRLVDLLFSLPFRILFLPYFFLSDKLMWSTAPTDYCIKDDKYAGK